jgi:hypothetical protein
MTRPSERELEHDIDDLRDAPAADDRDTVILKRTVVGTGWDGGDLEPGETETTVEEIEL